MKQKQKWLAPAADTWWKQIRKHKPSPPMLIGAASVLASLVVLFAGVHYFTTEKTPRNDAELRYYSLHQVAKKGLFEFLPARERLRESLSQEIGRDLAEDQGGSAREIAVFLFPDLLSADDFEKKQAFELWTPLLRTLENPTPSNSNYVVLDRLRATLWQYENPDRKAPRISRASGQLLRIYENLVAAEMPKQ